MMTVNDKWMAVAISTANPFGIRNVGIKIVEIFMHVLNEVRIMNPLLSVSTGTTTRTVYPSNLTGGTTPQKGDVAYTVATTISSLGSTAWRVDVRVTWPGNNRGIAESMTVTRQETFRQ